MTDGSVAGIRTLPSATSSGWLGRVRDHLLVLRFVLFNVVALGISAASWLQGWFDDALSGNTLWLILVIVAVFGYGIVECTRLVLQVNRDLTAVRHARAPEGSRVARHLDAVAHADAEVRSLQAGLLRLRLSHAIGIVRHVANALVLLGLVGTVIGFIVALSGVDPELTRAVDNVAPMVSTLITGMSIALYTTLVGALLHVWLMIGYRMLATATVQLYHGTVELGERHVRR